MIEALKADTLFLQFVVILALIVIDVVATVAWALHKGTYDWNLLLAFLTRNIVPYALIWGVLAGVGWAANTYLQINDGTLTSILVFVNIIYAGILLKLAHSILTTFSNLGIQSDKPDA